MKYIIAIIILSNISFSQIGGDQQLEKMFMDDKLDQIKNTENFNKSSIPYSRRIDPDLYKCGPGDMFQFKILPYQTKSEYLTVDPEGLLILPRNYGMLDVYNKSISEVRNEIKSIDGLNSPKTKVILSLFKPRTVIIQVRGNVKNPGLFTLSANMTVKDVIMYASEIKDNKLLTESNKINEYNNYANSELKKNISTITGNPSNYVFSERNIILQNQNNTRIIDLAVSEFKDKSQNPFIREGDIITIPKMDEDKNYYSVVGEVNNPSKISHRDGDDINTALTISGGLTENADINNSFLFLDDGTKVKLKFDTKLELQDFNPKINSGSTIVIGSKTKSSNTNFGLITIRGEVFNPGSFVIKEGESTLNKVIELAGGIKSTSCLNLSKIINLNDFEDKDFVFEKDIMDHLKYYDLTVEDTNMINLEYRLREPRVSLNFEEVVNGSANDVLLKDGDYIYISNCPTRTMVMGRVKQPGFIEFKAGKHPNWYINLAGGMVESADDNRIRIIRGGTEIWEEIDRNTIVMPGDIIYVPTHPIISKTTQTQEYAALAGILGAIGALGLFIIQLVNFVK
ncbi:SLBB domain-containing protein [Candidatus Kapabacteria bacterium]|nr:SLBB domain-containing protein [Candidatus Kapabacteria bacterium]